MLPRISYFPLCLAKPLQFLSRSNDAIGEEDGRRLESAWLQYKEQVLKWLVLSS